MSSQNILINDSDQPMRSDFGILKLVDLEESHEAYRHGQDLVHPPICHLNRS
jgi:hypothetical protein